MRMKHHRRKVAVKDDTGIGRLNVLSSLMRTKNRVSIADRKRFHELSAMIRATDRTKTLPEIEDFIKELEAV